MDYLFVMVTFTIFVSLIFFAIEHLSKTQSPTSIRPRYVRVCVACGSTDVEHSFSNAAAIQYGTTATHHCLSCGAEGKFFPEIDVRDVKHIGSQLKKKRTVNKMLDNIIHYPGSKEILVGFLFVNVILGAVVWFDEEYIVPAMIATLISYVVVMIIVMNKKTTTNTPNLGTNRSKRTSHSRRR